MNRIELNISSSRYLMGLFCLLYGLSVVAIFLSNLGIFDKIIIGLLWLMSLYWHLTRSIIKKAWLVENSWWLADDRDNVKKAELLPLCFVSLYVVILNFRLENRRRKSLILLKDSLSKDAFRRLKVYLLSQRG